MIKRLTRFVRHQRARAKRHAEDFYQISKYLRPNLSLPERVRIFASIMRWVQMPTADFSLEGERYGRLVFLLDSTDADTDLQNKLSYLFSSVISELESVSTLTQVGLLRENSFIQEGLERLLAYVLPKPVRYKTQSELIDLSFPDEDAAEWLKQMPSPLAERFVRLFTSDRNTFQQLKADFFEEIAEVIFILATESNALVFSESIRSRLNLTSNSIVESPFHELMKNTELLSQCLIGKTALEGYRTYAENCLSSLDRADCMVREVFTNLEESGISMDLVYRLEKVTHLYKRLWQCVQLLLSPDAQSYFHLCGQLVEGRHRDKSLVALFGDNIHQLSRKVVERTGDSGEHYITRNASEYWHMLKSAAGGGVLTTGTAVLKFVISSFKLPLFFEGVAASLNYAGSFVLMHFVGFKLATKQPSMTASALAKKLTEHQSQFEGTAIVDMVARITRSQFAAVVGNIGAVIPASILFHFVYRATTGHSFLTAEKARSVVQSLDPFTTPTLFYATLTGFLLWASSIGSGWVENWIVHRQIPEAIATNPTLHSFVGRKFSRRLSSLFQSNISGVWGSVLLGVFLAMTPVFGIFFGLPLDVRHVTLSSGSLTLAFLTGVNPGVYTIFASILGIAFIGFLNFSVSFVLALFVALRARDVGIQKWPNFLVAIWTEFKRSPGRFFYPATQGSNEK